MGEPTLSMEALELDESAIGDLRVPPSRRDSRYGGSPTARNSTITVKELEIHLGNRPLCWRLKDLYRQGHSQLPLPELELYEEYDVWMIAHAIGALRRQGSAQIQSLGYQAELDEDLAYTIELLPAPEFLTLIDTKIKVAAELGIEGRASVPGTLSAVLQESQSLGGDARVSLSTEAKVVGTIAFSLMTAVIQATGKCHSRCEWRFDEDKKPLLGDQMMFQTILVPAGTRSLRMRARAYALVQSFWVPFPAKYQTKQLELEVKPIG